MFKVSFKYVSGVFKVSFKSVSRVLKGNFMDDFIEVIAATRAYGGFVFILNDTNRYMVCFYFKRYKQIHTNKINNFTGSKLRQC